LQASVCGQRPGANQTSALWSHRQFLTSSDTGTVVGSGPVRASFMSPGAAADAHCLGSSTVAEANNNNLFGGHSISGFVLDQNAYTSRQLPAITRNDSRRREHGQLRLYPSGARRD